MNKKKVQTRVAYGLCFIVMLVSICIVMPHGQEQNVYAASLSIAGICNGQNVNVRTKAGIANNQLSYNEELIRLSKGQEVTILEEQTVNNERWYKISFKYNKTSFKGYVLSNYITLKSKAAVKGAIVAKTGEKIRTKAGNNTYVKAGKKAITLKKGTVVNILKEQVVSGKKWFYVSFTYNKKTYKGYVAAEKITFKVSAVAEKKVGYVKANRLNVRTGPGTTYAILQKNKKNVLLVKGTKVTIVTSKTAGKTIWHQVRFTYEGKSLVGYVSGDFISKEPIIPTASVKPTVKPSESISPSKMPQVSKSPVPSKSAVPSESPVPSKSPVPSISPSPIQSEVPSKAPSVPILTDAQFSVMLESERFPEDYKESLRALHKQYPLWQFRACHINYDWNTVINKESVVGTNLITNSKKNGWKSFEKGAYNWSKDTFHVYDGTSWVSASRKAIEYYMDPRNFLTTDGIFQFEYLGYNEENQDVSGVESILRNTVLSHASYSYETDAGEWKDITYGETFIEAAKYANVNPFHLATRVKQEVVTSSGLSESAKGTLAGYTGYYNFYNIGATHSTQKNGAIKNGLEFAKTGGKYSEANKISFLIPWNSPYKSIVGGAKFIGNNYISKGQNTVYLQKFNVSSYSTFGHQYMANVEAAKSEAQKTYAAYKNFTDIPVVFYIPVYQNMPAQKCGVPEDVENPNNWLKSLSVDGYTMTPTFDVEDSEDTVYTVFVDSDVEHVSVSAATVSSKAHMIGTGNIMLVDGLNTVPICVTAENGNTRTYTINIVKQ